MNDQDILKHIQDLINEEHTLMQQHKTQGGLEEDQHTRMRTLEISLDKCWDLLRQRRARRSAGLNPDEAQERDANTVEHYLQ